VFARSFLFPADDQLEQVGAAQRAMNSAFARMCRVLVGLHEGAPDRDVEFVGDQVALMLQVSPMTGRNLLGLALSAAALPGLLEAVEAHLLTERHVRAVLDELQKVPLSEVQQAVVVAVVLSRLGGQTPGELGRLVRRTVLLVDVHAAEHRQQARVQERRVEFRAGTDGEACVVATGPLAQIAAVRASLEATLGEAQSNDERTTDQRMFDLFVDLLTGGTDGPEHWDVAVVVPYTSTRGGDLELAEVPGFGPVLPSTARDLLAQTGSVRRIAVDDQDGHVIAVDDRQPVAPLPVAPDAPAAGEAPVTAEAPAVGQVSLPETVAQAVQRIADGLVELSDLSTTSYRIRAGFDASCRPGTDGASSPVAPAMPAAATWITGNPGRPAPRTVTICRPSAVATTAPSRPRSRWSGSRTEPTAGVTGAAAACSTNHPRATEPSPSWSHKTLLPTATGAATCQDVRQLPDRGSSCNAARTASTAALLSARTLVTKDTRSACRAVAGW